MRFIYIYILIILGPILLGTTSLFASDSSVLYHQTKQPSIFLDETIRVGFSPQQVFFLVAFPDIHKSDYKENTTKALQFSRYEAVLLAPFDTSDKQSQTNRVEDVEGQGALQTWRAGIKLAVPSGASSIKYAVIVAAPGNKFALIAPRLKQLSEKDLFAGSLSDLRNALLESRESLRKKRVEFDSLELELRRLRADADIIGDLGRIVEVRDELARVRQYVHDLKQDQVNLREFVRLVNNKPAPRNLAVRERQLNTQLSQLTEREKEVISSANSTDPQTGRVDLARKLAIIEQAKGLNIEELRHEYSYLSSSNSDTKPQSDSFEAPQDYLR